MDLVSIQARPSFTTASQSIINVRSKTDLQNANNVRKIEFRGHNRRFHHKMNDSKHRYFGER